MRNLMLVLAGLGVITMGTACQTAAPAGGGTTPDPLAEYKLGEDAEFDADIAAIATAINDSYACVDTDASLTDQNVLDALKGHYTGEADQFPQYVKDTLALDEAIRDTVCETDLGDDAALDAVIAQITPLVNEGLECQGKTAEETDADTLHAIKLAYLQEPSAYETLEDVADVLLDQAQQAVDEFCAVE